MVFLENTCDIKTEMQQEGVSTTSLLPIDGQEFSLPIFVVYFA